MTGEHPGPQPRPHAEPGAASAASPAPNPVPLLDRRLADWRIWASVAAAFGLTLLLRFTVVDATMVALATLAVALVVPRLEVTAPADWPRTRPHDRHGRRGEVAALTWSLAGRDGKVAEPAVRHLRTVAERRLARAGLPLSAGFVGPADERALAERDAARAVLGERAWTALIAPGGRLPAPGDVAACVRALEGVLDRADRDDVGEGIG